MTRATALRRVPPMVVLLGVLAATTAAALAGTGTPAHWGGVVEVPGMAALSAGGYARVNSVSCASAGECAAGGIYTDSSGRFQAFVVSEHGGVWGNAIEVPGLAGLNLGGNANVSSVSCGSPGNCAAGGYYLNFGQQAFVVAERDGVWGTAIGVPGVAARNLTGDAAVYSVSCGGPRTCTAIGSYNNDDDNYNGYLSQTFVVSEQDGVWGTRRDIPGHESSVSCGGADSCVAVGFSQDDWGVDRGFVVVERNGKWGNGKRVPGMWTLSAGRTSKVESVSCASPGNCAAAGYYVGSRGHDKFVFAMDEKNGKWSKPITVPGIKGKGFAWWSLSVTSVSCTSAGNCAAGGYSGHYPGNEQQPFVVGEVKGKWGQAITVRGLPALYAGNLGGSVTSVSCARAGNCAAVGYYFTDWSNHDEEIYPRAFAVTERNGVWSRAQHLRGLGATVEAISVSCVRAGNCAIGGVSSADYYPYPWDNPHGQAFVTAP